MTIFSKISKNIGFSRTPIVEYPTMDQVRETAKKAVEGDEYSFERLFNWIRYLRSPNNPVEDAIYDVMESGFRAAVPKFWVDEQGAEVKDELSIL